MDFTLKIHTQNNNHVYVGTFSSDKQIPLWLENDSQTLLTAGHANELVKHLIKELIHQNEFSAPNDIANALTKELGHDLKTIDSFDVKQWIVNYFLNQ